MPVLVRKIKYRSITQKKSFLVPSCLGPHSCGKRGMYGPIKKREFWNSTLTTPTYGPKADFFKEQILRSPESRRKAARKAPYNNLKAINFNY